MLKITNMVTVQITEVKCDQFNVIWICASGN